MGQLAKTVGTDDRAASLRQLRHRLALAIEEAPPSALAPLAKQLREVMVELESLAPKREASKLDDLAAKRAARRSDTASG